MLMRRTSRPWSGADIVVESVMVCERDRARCEVFWALFGGREDSRSIAGGGASFAADGI
jgi:hypothetical protein